MSDHAIPGPDADTLLELARQMAASGQPEAALSLIDDQQSPLGPEWLVLRGKLLAQLRRYPQATESWQAALELDPDNEQALRGVARARRAARPLWGRLHRYSSAACVAAALVVLAIGAAGFAARQLLAQLSGQSPQVSGDDRGERTDPAQIRRLEEALGQLRRKVESNAAAIDSQPPARGQNPAADDGRLTAITAQLESLQSAARQQSEELAAVNSQLNAKIAQLSADLGKLTPAEEFAQSLAALQTETKLLQEDFHDLSRKTYGWRADVLVDRFANLPAAGRDAESAEALLDDIELTIDRIESLPGDERFAEYADALRKWLRLRRDRPGR